jgi:hypothetical protein
MPIAVMFRKCKDNGEITAIFPEIIENDRYDYMCYAHVGQHGTASWGWVLSKTRPAQVHEFEQLLCELHRVGYNDICVVQRQSSTMRQRAINTYRTLTRIIDESYQAIKASKEGL